MGGLLRLKAISLMFPDISFANGDLNPLQTVIFSEAFGRLGNSLLAYAFLYQLSVGLGVDAYVSKSTRDLLLRYFTPDSIKLASLEETFCNPGDIQWEFYAEHMTKLFKDKSYRWITSAVAVTENKTFIIIFQDRSHPVSVPSGQGRRRRAVQRVPA